MKVSNTFHCILKYTTFQLAISNLNTLKYSCFFIIISSRICFVVFGLKIFRLNVMSGTIKLNSFSKFGMDVYNKH